MPPPSGPSARRGQFLTVAGAAQRAGVTPRTIRRWLQSGRLPAKRQAGHWVIRPTDLDRTLRPPAPSAGRHAANPSRRTSLRALDARMDALQAEVGAQRRATATLQATLENLRVAILVLREDLLRTPGSPLRAAALRRLIRDLEKSTPVTGRDSIRLLNPVRLPPVRLPPVRSP